MGENMMDGFKKLDKKFIVFLEKCGTYTNYVYVSHVGDDYFAFKYRDGREGVILFSAIQFIRELQDDEIKKWKSWKPRGDLG